MTDRKENQWREILKDVYKGACCWIPDTRLIENVEAREIQSAIIGAFSEVDRLRDDLKIEEMKVTRLSIALRKWNCTHCRAAYERGGCPDHGPSLTGEIWD